MKKWLALLLAVLMLCALVGCGDKAKPDDKDTPTTTTTKQEVVPIKLIEGEIPDDCYRTEDISTPARNMAVMMKANVNLTDVRWLALNPDPPTIDRVLSNHSLNKGEIWTVNTYINDAVPNRGVACTDENGKTYYYAITYSMKGDGSPSLSLTALNIEVLSEEQLDNINTFLNDPDNLGFVQRAFDRPEEVDWREVLTADVTFGVAINEWSEAEEQALRDACDGDFTGRPVRYPRADVEELFQKRLGLLPTELNAPISAPYLEEYDAYYCFFLGVEWVPTNVKSGKIENGLYIVDCSFGYYDEARRVTMRATDDGYQFISNVSIED